MALLAADSPALSTAIVGEPLSSPGSFSELFFDRNTSRNRLADDCFDNDFGGVIPVLLGLRDDGADSRLSTLPWKVADREGSEAKLSDGCDSGW